MARRTVAVIPPNTTLDAALAAMQGMGGVYPAHTLSLDTSAATGGMVIVHDPDAEPGAEPAEEAPAGRIRMELGVDAPGDLMTLAFSASDGEQEAGLMAMTLAFVALLEQSGAANYLTWWVQPPGQDRYGITVQRADGLTPVEEIDWLQGRAVDRMVKEFAVHTGGVQVRYQTIAGVVDELVDAYSAGDVERIAGTAAWAVYELYRLAFAHGIDLPAVVAELHRSRMTMDPGPDGTAVKGERFSSPDIAGVLARNTSLPR